MDSAIIDVAIGVLLLWFTLSLVCSTVTEGINRIVRDLRATHLREALQAMLRQEDTLVTALLRNPLVAVRTDQPPDWIRPRDFALAMFTELGQKGITSVDDMRTALARISDENLKRSLTSLVETASGSVDKALQQVADWFDGAMKEVTTWYQQRAQVVTRIVAVVLVLLLNADTIMYTRIIWQDQAIRAALVEVARQRVERAAGGSAQTAADPAETRAPAPGTQAPGIADVLQTIRAELAPLPLTWDFTAAGDAGAVNLRGLHWRLDFLALKLLGLALTYIALTFGAPFWFDLLRRMVGLRRGGPETKPAGTTP
jgi:hypothetical protein